MNTLTKSILTLASYDDKASDISMENVLRQCLMLISVLPMMAVYGYHGYNHYVNDDSLYIHRPDPNCSMAENILRMLRPDKSYTELEARVLDIALVLHMEHGGGNNSTFYNPCRDIFRIRYIFSDRSCTFIIERSQTLEERISKLFEMMQD